MSARRRKNHQHGEEPKDITLRVKALESLLLDKGLVDERGLDEIIETYEHKIGPHNGAKVVARAWIEPSYKEWLLSDGTAARIQCAIPRARALGLIRVGT